MKNINWTQLGLIAIIIVLICILFSQCQNNKTQLSTIDALNSKNTSYRLKNGQLVESTKTLLAFNQKQAIDLIGKDEVKELTNKFSKVNTITKYIEKLRIDSVKIAYKDSVPCIFERTGTIKNIDFSLNYKSNQKGISIDSLEIENKVTIVSGMKRKWFWGKETYVTDVTNSNKLIKIDSLQHVEIQPKKRFYDTNLFKISVGFILGKITSK
jgi:hypothetical protein